MSFYPHGNELFYLLSFCNSKISIEILKILAPTINFQAGDISRLPIIFPKDESIVTTINSLVEQNISLSKTDWDSFETSWDFKKHPLV